MEDTEPETKDGPAKMIHAVKELLENMKSTSGCRFNAAKRLEAREQALTRLTALTSAYVVGLTVLPYFLHLPAETTDRLNLITVFFAIVILVSSLLQYSTRDGVNAEQHHRCALEIAQARRELKLDGPNADSKLAREYTERYNRILEKYSINHDGIDYCQYQVDRPEDFPWIKKAGWLWIYAKLFAAKQSINIALLLVTMLLMFVLIRVGVFTGSLFSLPR